MLIGFTGVPGSGKTFSAHTMVGAWRAADFKFIIPPSDLGLSLKVKVVSFSEPIKKITNILFPDWNENHLRGELKDVVDPNHGTSPRKVQQVIGKSLMEINNKLWSEYLFRKLDKEKVDYTANNSLIIVDDVRFDSDFDAIKSRGGVMIGLTPGSNSPTVLTDEAKNYETEKHAARLVTKCDHTYNNNYDEHHTAAMKSFILDIYNSFNS